MIEAWLSDNISGFSAAKKALESVADDPITFQRVLNHYYDFNSNYPDGFYIASRSGNVWFAEQAMLNLSGDQTRTIWFREGLSRINMNYGKQHVNHNGKMVISASGILLDDSDDIKIIAADLSLDRINIIVSSLIEMESAESILVDKDDGNILAHRNTDIISTGIHDYPDSELLTAIAKKVDAREDGLIVSREYLIQFQSIANTPWVLVSYVPQKVILADLYALRNYVVIISVISLIVIAVLIERIVHRTIKPVKYLTDRIVTMSDGDFTFDVEVRGNDEISIMSASVKEFTAVMREMIRELGEISEQLHQKSNSSNKISQELSETSNTQAESMSNLKDTVEQLAISVGEIAKGANSLNLIVNNTTERGAEVNQKMTETVRISEQGQQEMEKVKEAMNRIQHSVSDLETAVNKVGTASDEITTIINLIGSIAEETNLLALNASIEAARAGEAGRGFAVVATEIGKLANTSADAVQKISSLISDVSVLVQDSVKQAGDSALHIRKNSEMISNAAANFDTIFNSIQMTNDIVDQMIEDVRNVDTVASSVASISQEQAANSEEILATSELMLEQSQVIADNSKNVADDAESLSETAKELGSQVGLFKI